VELLLQFYSKSKEDVLKTLATNEQNGLSESYAAELLQKHGKTN